MEILPQTHQAEQEISAEDDAIDPDDVVIHRVARGWMKADRMLQAEKRKKIWLVVCYEEVGRPEVHELRNMDELRNQLRQLQNWQHDTAAREAGQSLFYFIFHGDRWATQQVGDKLIGVYDQNEVHPMSDTGETSPPHLNYEGKLSAVTDVADENNAEDVAVVSDVADDVGDPQII